jgi:enoyl-[acyl-carrier-protein] reductase (NADH)
MRLPDQKGSRELDTITEVGRTSRLEGSGLLLVSDAGAHITGQVIVVDGGMTVI